MENKILAVVDGRSIARTDLDRLMMQLGQNAMRYANPEGEKVLLEELVNQELFYSDAIANGIDKNPEFLKILEHETRQILKQYAISQLLGNIEVTDAEVAAHYESKKEEFKTPDRVQANHILVDTEEQAISIKNEIEAGMSFGQAALTYSKCPSKERGGDLGFFGRGQMVPEFEEAAFALPLNVVSEPVGTQFGYHLIEVTGKEEAGLLSFEEVAADLKRDLATEKQGAVYTEKVNALKNQFSVEII